jgi:hypothetical protein
MVVECWFKWNNSKHDTDGDPILREKEKVVDKISWNIKRKNKVIPNQ